MFNQVSDDIMRRIRKTCNIEETNLNEIQSIVEEETIPIEILSNKKTEVLKFNESDFHLIQFPVGANTLGSMQSSLQRMSDSLNKGLDCKKNYIFAYTDEKMKIETLDKDKIYIFKVPTKSMSVEQIKTTLSLYNNKISEKLSMQGYSVTFVADI